MLIAPNEDITAKRAAGFQVLASAAYDTLFPHDALREVFREPEGSHRYRTLILQVGRQLEREASRTLVTVRGVGYRVAKPSQHLALAQNRHRRAMRQKRRSLAILEATPVNLLSPEERRRLDDAKLLYARHLSDLRRIKVRVQQEHATTEQLVERRITKVEAALARIEAMGKPA